MLSNTFICGCGHSGTTLLANMFAGHAQVFVPLYETQAFRVAEEAPRRWAEVREAAEASGRPHLVEKTPRHFLHMDLIRSLVPGARFIVMLRDGRDVAASYQRRDGEALAGARRWLSENRVALEERDKDDVALLRYEDLIEAPEARLRALCSFAGFAFDPQMLRYHEEERMWFGMKTMEKGTGRKGYQHKLLRNWQINQPIFDGRGQWRETLAPDDLAFFDRPTARAMLDAFGYA